MGAEKIRLETYYLRLDPINEVNRKSRSPGEENLRLKSGPTHRGEDGLAKGACVTSICVVRFIRQKGEKQNWTTSRLSSVRERREIGKI